MENTTANNNNLKDYNNVNEVQAKLLAQLAAADKEQERSTFLSPLSIYACLLLLTEGLSGDARKECTIFLDLLKTKGKLLSPELALSFKNLLNSKSPAFTMANSIWVNKNLELVAAYKKKVQDHHNALVKSIEMNSAGKAEINEWVSNSTNGLIRRISGSIGPATLLVIINAIYFKGTWKSIFKSYLTSQRDFHLSQIAGHKVQVPTMVQTFKAQYTETEINRLVVLPFEEDNIHFVASIPKDTTNFDPLTAFKATDIPQALEGTKKKVNLTMPKFKIERTFDVKDLVQKLGLSKIFGFGNSEDFRGIIQDGEVVVSAITQKAVIELDEHGAKAAAVTEMMLLGSCYNPNPEPIIEMTLNRPFAFFLVDKKSKLILFSGVYRGTN